MGTPLGLPGPEGVCGKEGVGGARPGCRLLGRGSSVQLCSPWEVPLASFGVPAEGMLLGPPCGRLRAGELAPATAFPAQAST